MFYKITYNIQRNMNTYLTSEDTGHNGHVNDPSTRGQGISLWTPRGSPASLLINRILITQFYRIAFL